MKMRKLMAVVLAVVVAISAMAISAFATEYETVTIPLANYTTTTTNSTTYAIEIPFYGVNGYLYYGDTIELVLPLSIGEDYGLALTPDYSLTTAEGITVDLQDPDQGTVVYCTMDGTVLVYDDTNAYWTYEDGTVYTVWDSDTSSNVNGEPEFFKQTVEVGYSYRDYLYTWAGGLEVNAMIHQTTIWSSSCNLTINATVDTTGTGYTDPAGYSVWTSFYRWWGSTGQSSILTYYTADSNSTDPTTIVYGYSCGVTYTTGSDSDDDLVTILTATDGEDSSTNLYWDHTLTYRGMIQTALATEGAYAQVEVELASAINGYAVYTLYSFTDATATGEWGYGYGSYWYDTTYYSVLSALASSTAVSSYTLVGSTDTLVFEDVPLSCLYDTTYGIYNVGFTIQQLITADSSSLGYKYYTNSTDNTLEATEVSIVLYIPVDDTAVDADEPVEDTDTATEEDGEDDTDLDVNDVDETPDETNPTTGIVLALVPMAVAAAAAVASKRR